MKDIDKAIVCFLTLEELKQLIKSAIAEELSSLQHTTQEVDSIYLTRAETADMLKVSLPTLSNWTKQGKIPAYRFGNNIRYKKHEIDNSLKSIKTIKNGKQ